MASDQHQAQTDDEPRALSDHQVRDKHSREQVQRWREEAARYHQRWFRVMNNPYGRD